MLHTAIRVKRAELPTKFPPARLFLDDIEEIVRVLREACRKQQNDGGQSTSDVPSKVKFQVGNKECDEVSDLPKIGRKSTQLSIEVRVAEGWRGADVTLNRFFTNMDTRDFDRGEHLELFRILMPSSEQEGDRGAL